MEKTVQIITIILITFSLSSCKNFMDGIAGNGDGYDDKLGHYYKPKDKGISNNGGPNGAIIKFYSEYFLYDEVEYKCFDQNTGKMILSYLEKLVISNDKVYLVNDICSNQIIQEYDRVELIGGKINQEKYYESVQLYQVEFVSLKKY